MWRNKYYLSSSLMVTGWTLLGFGVFLLMVKLLMFAAEYAGPAIALAGVILLVVGSLAKRA